MISILKLFLAFFSAFLLQLVPTTLGYLLKVVHNKIETLIQLGGIFVNILILEDDVALAKGMTLALASDDFSFVCCQTIAHAREILTKQSFDLLLLDVNLPDGSGLTFCQELRQTTQVPIILLTARDMELDIVTGLESGANDYITKPFSLMVLRARIRNQLKQFPQTNQNDYSKPPFSFSFNTLTFGKNQQEIFLSKTEQRILYLLVNNPQQIITRERLIEFVWPDGSEFVEDNALSVGIRRLREKLEEEPMKPKYIKTIYGQGYTWEVCP